MVGIDLWHQQRLVVKYLKEDGVLDNQFDQVLDIRTPDNPRFVLEVISMFLNDADICVEELDRLLNEDVVDFVKVVNYTHQLRGSSSSIGGRQLANACRELRLATDEMDRDRCLVAFDKVKNDYRNLKNNFNSIAEIETLIVVNTGRRHSRHNNRP